MAVKPSLALIPKGVKANKVYSVLPADGVGDFDFSRSGSATRVNKQGLIETVGSNVPRLNYPLIDGVVSGCPSLLLEPQRSNIIPYSEDFSNAAWVKGSSTVNANQTISPDGTLNADLIVTSAAGGGVSDGIGGSGNYSFSVFVKYKDIQFIRLRSTNSYAWFDIENGSVGTKISALDAKIEDYGNGWYRCTLVGNNSNTIIQVTCTERNGANVGFGSVYLWGAQFEAGSYETSYIKSNDGGTVTRSAETCNNAGDANTFNDSEGVLMADISALNDTVDGYNTINIGSNSSDNRLGFGFDDQSRIYGFKRTTTSWNTPIEANINEFNKVAISYNTNDNHFWLNGFKVDSNTTIGDITQPIELDFRASYGGEQFYGSAKQIQYFDTALNDTDLETLTSWTSFNEMATSQLYSIQ